MTVYNLKMIQILEFLIMNSHKNPKKGLKDLIWLLLA